MTRIDARPLSAARRYDPAEEPRITVYEAREHDVSPGLTVRRSLPHPMRRLVGPWVFVDHFGPVTLDSDSRLSVGAHPHTGLCTLTWMLEGQVLHRDSLGSEQVIRPGEVNWMTTGRGMSHTEVSPEDPGPTAHGVQLWLALPPENRQDTPAFHHYAEIPELVEGNASIQVIMGKHLGFQSPVRAPHPAIALDITLTGDEDVILAYEFEHALFVLEGEVVIEEQSVAVGQFMDLGRRRYSARVETSGARVLVLGGAPYEAPFVMWWNFIAGDPERIRESREAWNNGTAFGSVDHAPGRLIAPDILE